MVGDIVSDPLEALVGGTVIAGAWVVNQVWQTQYDTWVNTQNATKQWTSGFTSDDLVDVPPPPAEDLGTVVPDSPPLEGDKGATSSGSSGKTFEEYATELVQNEAKYGIQSPIGPDGGGSSLAVPTQENAKDPQAPLKPGFGPNPEPNTSPIPLTNKILQINWNDAPYPPQEDGRVRYYAKFRGQPGPEKVASVNGWRAFAMRGGTESSPQWSVRVEALRSGSSVAVWNFDAGTTPPSPGELAFWLYNDYLVDYGNGGHFDQTPFEPNHGESGGYYPLTQNVMTPVPQAPINNAAFNPSTPKPAFLQKPKTWTDIKTNDSESSNFPAQGQLPTVSLPVSPPLPTVPPTSTPTPVNNPASFPVIGSNGFPVFNLPSNLATAADVHRIGDIAVNSGKIRATTASIAKEVGRIEQKSAKIAQGTGSLLDNLGDIADLIELINFIKELLEAPLEPKTLTLNPVCEEDKDPTSVVLPSEKYTDRIQSTLDAIPVLLQAHLGYKTPICEHEKPALLGSWVTTRWLSDGDSPNGGRRLRKLFRYRTQSSRTNEELSGFWDGFTWQAGPTLVEHRGAWWGNPAVWAIDAAEGKRVIRNAAREAGLDPDMDGEWFVGSSRSPRIGMEGTMRLAPLGRWNHVVSRDGSDGYPSDS
jgi:hypothetical protein